MNRVPGHRLKVSGNEAIHPGLKFSQCILVIKFLQFFIDLRSLELQKSNLWCSKTLLNSLFDAFYLNFFDFNMPCELNGHKIAVIFAQKILQTDLKANFSQFYKFLKKLSYFRHKNHYFYSRTVSILTLKTTYILNSFFIFSNYLK